MLPTVDHYVMWQLSQFGKCNAQPIAYTIAIIGSIVVVNEVKLQNLRQAPSIKPSQRQTRAPQRCDRF
eukprot:3035304-Amphidinium_carterae.1